MKAEIVYAKVVLDKRKELLSGKYPLKLRITFKGDRKYYATGYEASESEMDLIQSTSPRGKLKQIKAGCMELELKAGKFLNDFKPFTFSRFEDEFFEKAITYASLSASYQTYIDKLKANSQIGTAISYLNSITSIKSFNPNLKITDFNPEVLQQYERWMISNGKSITTVGIYLRALRTILNKAVDDGELSLDQYPFGTRKYSIPTGKNIKKALDIQDIKQIFSYHTEPGSFIERAKDFWIFSYLCNGINFTDVANLKWKDISHESITFERQKTIRSKRGAPVKIVAANNLYRTTIISKWGKPKTTDPSKLVFSIIDIDDSPATAKRKINQFIKNTNKWMKRMGEQLELDVKLTTYVARHSFATILIRNGAPLEFASQSLGHSNLITTQKYFAGFNLEDQENYAKSLVGWG